MRKDYERFMRELEEVVSTMNAVNVAGIAPGLCAAFSNLIIEVIRLKQNARFIGGRVDEEDNRE